jgi:hypothetical protein
MEKKKKVLVAIICVLVFIIILIAIYFIGRNPLGFNYTSIGDLWTVPIFEEFNDEYGVEYSQRLQENIIENMKVQVRADGEDAEEMEKCLKATGQFGGHDSPRLPCYAERARFEYYSNHRGVDPYELEDMEPSELGPTTIEECWIFVINWGMEGEPLGHIKIYAISTEDCTILYYSTCG